MTLCTVGIVAVEDTKAAQYAVLDLDRATDTITLDFSTVFSFVELTIGAVSFSTNPIVTPMIPDSPYGLFVIVEGHDEFGAIHGGLTA